MDFSPDSQWLAYTVVGENYFTQVRLHDFVSGKSVDLTDSFVQTDTPVFGGSDLLYFTASIDAGPTRVTLDMSTQERPLRLAIYAAVLSAAGHSPLPPKSGDEEAKANKEQDKEKDAKSEVAAKSDAAAKSKKSGEDDKADKPVKPTRVDAIGLSQRLVPIPVAERNYERLVIGSDGALFYLARRQPGSSPATVAVSLRSRANLWRVRWPSALFDGNSILVAIIGVTASAGSVPSLR